MVQVDVGICRSGAEPPVRSETPPHATFQLTREAEISGFVIRNPENTRDASKERHLAGSGSPGPAESWRQVNLDPVPERPGMLVFEKHNPPPRSSVDINAGRDIRGTRRGRRGAGTRIAPAKAHIRHADRVCSLGPKRVTETQAGRDNFMPTRTCIGRSVADRDLRGDGRGSRAGKTAPHPYRCEDPMAHGQSGVACIAAVQIRGIGKFWSSRGFMSSSRVIARLPLHLRGWSS